MEVTYSKKNSLLRCYVPGLDTKEKPLILFHQDTLLLYQIILYRLPYFKENSFLRSYELKLEALSLYKKLYQTIPLALGRVFEIADIPLALGRVFEKADIPFRIIIHNILPYLQYRYNKNSNFDDIKTLFGYFKSDYSRKKWLIWRGLDCYKINKLKKYPLLTSLKFKSCKISELKKYPLLTSLKIEDCYKISKLNKYPLLTSLRLYFCTINELKEYPLLINLQILASKINELKEYPLLTYLTISGKISELKEYPLLTTLTLQDCSKISKLKEYPLLTFLSLWKCKISELKEYPLLTSLIINSCNKINGLKEYPQLTYLSIVKCKHLEDIHTKNKEDIQRYIKKYTPK